MFEVGDVVVCIKDAKPLMPSQAMACATLRKGSVHRVEGVIVVRDELGLLVSGADHRPFAGWKATLFRKLPKADASFTEQMRALRPHKAPVTASEANHLMMIDIVEQG